jgi:hypothetical protein
MSQKWHINMKCHVPGKTNKLALANTQVLSSLSNDMFEASRKALDKVLKIR